MTDDPNTAEPYKKGEMPFLDHVEELRRRLLKSIVAIVVMAVIAFYFADHLVRFIIIPLGDEVQLYNILVTGTFYAYIKISLVTGLLAALPIVFYQLWSFISSGLYPHEKAKVLPLVLVSTFLFLAGGAFCYVLVLPLAFDFLINFAGELVVNAITIGSYINFVGLLLLAFGFGFQMPVLAYFLGKLGLVTSRRLAKGRRYAIVLILVVGAIITPPDVFTQCLLAIPLYILYEVSIIVVKVSGRREGKEAGV